MRKAPHGHASGGAKTKEYQAWQDLKHRCRNPNNPKYGDYGGRGISFCKRWEKFENFLADMGLAPTKKHTLDRKNNEGPYCKRNCRWATWYEQRGNKRTNRWLVIDGERKILREWNAISKFKKNTIYWRLTNGWSAKEAVFGRSTA